MNYEWGRVEAHNFASLRMGWTGDLEYCGTVLSETHGDAVAGDFHAAHQFAALSDVVVSHDF